VNEEKTKAQSGTGSLQQGASQSREQKVRSKINAIRQGHATGGYCDTDALKEQEKELDGILVEKIKALEIADASGNRAAVALIERERKSFAWKPKLVVSADQ